MTVLYYFSTSYFLLLERIFLMGSTVILQHVHYIYEIGYLSISNDMLLNG